MSDDELNLAVMVDALAKVERFVEGVPLDAFLADDMRVDATAMNLLVVGEYADRLSEPLRQAVPAPWRRIVNLRHQLAHAYAGIDAEQLWSIATQNAPELTAQVRA